MKAALNGVPQASTLDGWWIEGCIENVTGWSLGPHPQDPGFKEDELQLIVDWVLSLKKKQQPSLPAKGSITPTEQDMGAGNILQLTAVYTDKGRPGIRPLSSAGSITLRSALLNMPSNSGTTRVDVKNWREHKAAFLNGDDGYLEFSNINLDGIKSIELAYGIPQQLDKGYLLTIYQDSPDSNPIAELKLENLGGSVLEKSNLVLQNVKSGEGHKLILKIARVDKAESHRLAVISMKLLQNN